MIRAAAAGATLVVVAGALAAGGTGSGGRESAVTAPAKRDRLTSFASCTALTGYARARAAALVRSGDYGAYPVAWSGAPARSGAPVPAMPAPLPSAAPEAGPVAEDGAATPGDTSGTNVQEAGVGEPDLAVTDGAHLFTVESSVLRAVTVRGAPRLAGALPIEGAGEARLLRIGGRLLVISDAPFEGVPVPVDGVEAPASDAPASPGAVPAAPPAGAPVRAVAPDVMIVPSGPPAVIVRLVDIRDPAEMRVLSTMRLEGRFVGAREVDGVVRLVVSTAPDALPFQAPGAPETPTVAAATAHNRRVAARAPARTWLPVMTITRAGRAPVESRAVRCRDVRRPTRFSGLGTLSVLTLDPARGLEPVDRDAVMTDGDIVYGSATGLYVTTPQWTAPDVTAEDLPAGASTQIHRFDTSARTATRYRASGHVPGWLLNQFSLSEHDGDLRVASTRDPVWTDTGQEVEASESSVTVLRERDGRLVRIGSVTGLGRTERIHAVRFIGETGYVVTFRRTDPLYVVDLRDPTRPAVRGELKVPGYSAYLHPVGDGLLLGVGQDADDTGRVRGTQVALFDVADPTRPRRLAARTYPGGWSEVEADHHAFLFWSPTRLAMVPMVRYDDAGPDARAVGLRVGRAEGLVPVGAVAHPDPAGAAGSPEIRRTFVVGDRVVTVSAAGVGFNDRDDLTARAFVRFPR